MVSEFPTPVGMNQHQENVTGSYDGVPHARGDEPFWVVGSAATGWSSPRPWG